MQFPSVRRDSCLPQLHGPKNKIKAYELWFTHFGTTDTISGRQCHTNRIDTHVRFWEAAATPRDAFPGQTRQICPRTLLVKAPPCDRARPRTKPPHQKRLQQLRKQLGALHTAFARSFEAWWLCCPPGLPCQFPRLCTLLRTPSPMQLDGNCLYLLTIYYFLGRHWPHQPTVHNHETIPTGRQSAKPATRRFTHCFGRQNSHTNPITSKT